MSETPLIRATESLCPQCLKTIEASLVEREGAVYLQKRCPEHGEFGLLVSRHPGYYRPLNDFYFSLFPGSLPQHDYIVHLTNRCGLNCPICLADANSLDVQDLSLETLRAFLRKRRGRKIDLMGAEPTMREDLPQIIRLVRRSGNIAALHTNGIRIAEYGYLASLKDAGVEEVHLQFDGFDDAVYERIRGKPLLEVKMKALENLERLGIATDLVVTVVRGVNEQEMSRVLQYGLQHRFVREVFFLGCRFLGKASRSDRADCLMPDELIDPLEQQTGGMVSRSAMFYFQKLYFSLLSAFSVRKCFYIHHFLLVKTAKGPVGIEKVIDLKRMEASLERYRRLAAAGSLFARPYLAFALLRALVAGAPAFWLREFLSYAVAFVRGFGLSRLPTRTLLIGFISACDAYSIDLSVARNCGKGAVSPDLGVLDSGALYNVFSDRLRTH